MVKSLASRPGARSGPRAGRKLRIALFASLALNLAVIGVVAGASFDRYHRPPPPSPTNFGPYGEALTKEQRRAIYREFVRQAPEMRDMRNRFREDLTRVAGLMQQPDYDAATVARIFEEQDARMQRTFKLGHRLLIERIQAMSPDERRAFAERLQAAIAREDARHREGEEEGVDGAPGE